MGEARHAADDGAREGRTRRGPRSGTIPQFLTEIDGLDIHFIHVRSENPHAMPLLLTHGWPGSIVEFLKPIGPLTDPVSFGEDADAFDVVIPSLPGFGFSQKPTETGWTVSRIAGAWVELTKRLGCTRWAAQGGDRGASAAGMEGVRLPWQVSALPQHPDGSRRRLCHAPSSAASSRRSSTVSGRWRSRRV
ncbi:epoxide hydrolase [Streptomyces sp. NPDC127079]|uniref:epoxide hydrolase family protein n=1 Tax=Streptomyces sp. NPDC127079 TaxID=3347132 RepID=UPI00364CC511